MTDGQKLIGIVVSPKKTFDAINQRPTWILPLAWLVIFNLLTQFVVFQVVVTDANFDQIARAKIEWDSREAGSQPTPASVKQQLDMLRSQRKYWYVTPLIGIPISLLPLSICFYIVLRLARAGTTFRKVFAVFCWSFLIYRCIGGIAVIAALLIHGSANFFPAPPEAWSPTSLAQLVSRDAVSPYVYAAISKLDIFLLWWLAVLATGLSRTSKNLTIARSAAIVTATEVAYLAINAAGWLP
jgi:Yip1 domain